MLIQVTAYDVIDTLMVGVTAAETTSTGRSWTNLIQDSLEIPAAIDQSDPWELTWLLVHFLADPTSHWRPGPKRTP